MINIIPQIMPVDIDKLPIIQGTWSRWNKDCLFIILLFNLVIFGDI